jgi:hypothetical protein
MGGSPLFLPVSLSLRQCRPFGLGMRQCRPPYLIPRAQNRRVYMHQHLCGHEGGEKIEGNGNVKVVDVTKVENAVKVIMTAHEASLAAMAVGQSHPETQAWVAYHVSRSDTAFGVESFGSKEAWLEMKESTVAGIQWLAAARVLDIWYWQV